MSIIEIIIIAIVEAMDCFAVAIATGLSKKGIKYSLAERWFNSVGTPIACTILCILGGRMIWGAVRGDAGEEEGEQIAAKNLTIANILLLSVATSIDAFAVGISFAFLNANMVLATSAIALASFIMGVIGYEIGRHAAKRFKTKIPEIIAGIILIAIGIKMLL